MEIQQKKISLLNWKSVKYSRIKLPMTISLSLLQELRSKIELTNKYGVVCNEWDTLLTWTERNTRCISNQSAVIRPAGPVKEKKTSTQFRWNNNSLVNNYQAEVL